MGSIVASETLQKAIPKARWWRIIPPTIIIYIIAYMDRMNISFAMAGGMNKELGMSMAASGLAAGIFFWGYLVLQVPAGHIAEHGSAKKFIMWSIIAWGGLSTLTGLVHNFHELLIIRFLLGVAEGGVYPAILIVVGKWFPKKELGRANALFLMSLPISTILTNPISGWIVANHSWRWLFVYEGAVSLLLIFIWMPMISDRPEEAKWISKEEKEYLITTMAREKAETEAALLAEGAPLKWSYTKLFLNKNLWLLVLVYMCYTTGQYGYTLWLPTLLKQLTKSSLTAVGWMTSLPFVMALGGLYLMGALSDKKGNRRLYTALSLVGFGVIFFLATLFFPGNIGMCFGLLVLTGLFTKSMQSPFWAMPAVVFPPGVAGGARGAINALGNLGGFFGPVLMGWFATRTGNLNYGVYSLVVVLLIGGGITMLLPRVTAGRFKQELEAKPASTVTKA
jgi:MFS family permease